MEKLLTTTEASQRMGISKSLLYRLVAKGAIDCYRIGKQGIRFSWPMHIAPYLEKSQRKDPPSY